MIELNFTIIIQMINFLILVFILHRFLFKPITEVLEKRGVKVSGLKGEAVRFQGRASDIESSINKKLGDIKKEGMEDVEASRKKAVQEQEKLLEETKNRCTDKITTAKNEIAEEARHVSESLKSESGSLAQTLASRVLKRKIV